MKYATYTANVMYRVLKIFVEWAKREMRDKVHMLV